MKTIILLTAVLISANVMAADEKPKSSPETIAAGKVLFEKNCMVCHGATGAGDGVAAAALNPKPRNFKKDKFKNGDKPEQILASITKGMPPLMAPFDSLPASDRWSLVYYVLSLKGK